MFAAAWLVRSLGDEVSGVVQLYSVWKDQMRTATWWLHNAPQRPTNAAGTGQRVGVETPRRIEARTYLVAGETEDNKRITEGGLQGIHLHEIPDSRTCKLHSISAYNLHSAQQLSSTRRSLSQRSPITLG